MSGPSLTRDSTFSYMCTACNSCCYDKVIHVNPYEVARIAAHLECSTTAVLTSHTENGGTVLRVRNDGSCTFLGVTGCTIHGDRPLACRLYPLGRVVLHDETEVFVEVAPHPRSTGIYGSAGTIGSFMEEQEVRPYIEAARRYRDILTTWMRGLSSEMLSDATRASAVHETRDKGPDVPDVLDVDYTVRTYCARNGEPEPTSVHDRVNMHVAVLESMFRDP